MIEKKKIFITKKRGKKMIITKFFIYIKKLHIFNFVFNYQFF